MPSSAGEPSEPPLLSISVTCTGQWFMEALRGREDVKPGVSRTDRGGRARTRARGRGASPPGGDVSHPTVGTILIRTGNLAGGKRNASRLEQARSARSITQPRPTWVGIIVEAPGVFKEKRDAAREIPGGVPLDHGDLEGRVDGGACPASGPPPLTGWSGGGPQGAAAGSVRWTSATATRTINNTPSATAFHRSVAFATKGAALTASPPTDS